MMHGQKNIKLHYFMS